MYVNLLHAILFSIVIKSVTAVRKEKTVAFVYWIIICIYKTWSGQEKMVHSIDVTCYYCVSRRDNGYLSDMYLISKMTHKKIR